MWNVLYEVGESRLISVRQSRQRLALLRSSITQNGIVALVRIRKTLF